LDAAIRGERFSHTVRNRIFFPCYRVDSPQNQAQRSSSASAIYSDGNRHTLITRSHVPSCRSCIACVDGLKGLPEAIEAGFLKTQGPWCSVQKVRNRVR